MVQRLKSWWKSRLDEQSVPEKDPIVHSSFALPLALFSLLLMVSLLWAFYQEGWGLRPWRAYQSEFSELYGRALLAMKPDREAEEKAIKASTGYQELLARARQAEEAIRTELGRIEQEEQSLRATLAAITKPFTTARSEIQATIYQLETADEDDKEGLREELQELQEHRYQIETPQGVRVFLFEELKKEFTDLKARQGQLQSQKVELLRGPAVVRREMETYMKQRLTGPTEAQVNGLLHKVDTLGSGIRQIHNAEMGLVDRCESCHLGIREPVRLTAETMGGEGAFTSHPRPELLKIHDPEIFGCSPCHNGNGVGVVSAVRAHGQYKHWLWPLYARENFEAGCLQCHEADHRLEGAPTLNAGKTLFQNRGCQGCHPHQGFEREPRELRDVQKNIADLQAGREEAQLKISRLVREGDEAESNEEANRLYAEADKTTLSIAATDADLDRLHKRVDDLLMEVKKIGPNLKEVRNKLRKEWIPVWIKNPQAFRPTTKMPQFRLEEDEVKAVAAFIWQSGLATGVPKQPPGDAERGKELFETRGCMACHSVGEGDQLLGGDFAANLSRVGEKASYDYLVRWVHNPRQRSLPYCPVHKRDITPEDYAAQGLPFQFDLENNRCPLGDHLLQVQNQVVMPSLRLTLEEARDIASYLRTLRRADVQYPPATFMDDAALFERGRFLVRHYGCAGCHEIASLENEGKIATDLTVEGSKPIERLDFALLTHDAKREGWYTHKGFFEHKLRKPEVYDRGKIKEPLERLRMPNFHLSDEQIDQVTTFLLGSVESKIPEKFHYRPADDRRDAQAGWWIVKKYNCVGCHEFAPGQATALQSLPRYQGDAKEKLPPSLVGEGARVNPQWLARFLQNPALSVKNVHRNGVRPYLDVRMPTFNLSDGEVQKLVRFFQSLSKKPLPYMAPKLEPLTRREVRLARQLFTHPAAPCLLCHATGDPVRDRNATAPSFALVGQRLKSDWTKRWIVHPEIIRPGTAMPSGLFRRQGERWVFALAELDSFRSYQRDHADLVVRYMFQFTPEEQRRLTGHSP
ncbi:MAG: c-type cytochrome [Acidobacteriota bacterium]